jgi:hypothetical protein
MDAAKRLPRSDLERLRLVHQGTVYPPTARRRDLIASTKLKRQKEIAEWISHEGPNGIEILARIAKTPTDYARLIQRALADIRVGERRAAALFARETVEFTARQADTEASLAEIEAHLAAVLEENARLRGEIERGSGIEASLRGELRRSFDASRSAPAIAPSSPKPRPLGRSLIDPVAFFVAEREKLEAALSGLEDRLRVLNQEQIALLCGNAPADH